MVIVPIAVGYSSGITSPKFRTLSLWKSSTIHGELGLSASLSWKERLWTKPSWSMTSVPKKRAQPGRDPMFIKCYKWVFPKIRVPQNGWFIIENPIKMDDLGIPLFLETSKFCQVLFFGLSLFCLWWTYSQLFKQHTCGRRGSGGSLMKLYSLTPFFWKKTSGDKMSTFLVMNTHHSRLNIWRFHMRLLAFLFRECFVTLERKFDIHRLFLMISTKRCWSQNFWCGMAGWWQKTVLPLEGWKIPK